MPVVPFAAPALPKVSPNLREVDPTMLIMAAAELHGAGRLIEAPKEPTPGPPMDIRSPAQKGDLQKKSNTWPEGTSPEVKNTFDKHLRDGTITREQYNKAMRDPRQFTGND